MDLVNKLYLFALMILISAEYAVYIMCVCYFGDCRLVCFVCIFVDSFVIKIFQLEPTVQHFKEGQTHFFKRNPSSNKGDPEETHGDGTNIHSTKFHYRAYR